MCETGVSFQIADQPLERVKLGYGGGEEDPKAWVCGVKAYKGEGCGRILEAWPRQDPASPTLQALGNGLVEGVVRAYCRHHSLLIRPDDVWLAIAIQFGLHVNAAAESMRHLFVSHEGKKQLSVCQNACLATADFARFSLDMVSQLQRNLNDPAFSQWLLPCFSTTTHTDTIVGSIALMASTKHYFHRRLRLACGIPRLTLAGTPQDWEDIHARLHRLLLYGEPCRAWASMLGKITSQFIRASRRDVDLDFWSRICDYRSGGSGPAYLSGWITAFCVFDGNGKWQATRFELPGRFSGLSSIALEFPVIETKDIPPGYITVDVTIDDNGVEHEAVMFAGHMCCEVVEDGHGIAPKLAWAIALKS